MSTTQIGIVDDHHLFSNALATLINKGKNYQVCLTASDGTGLRSALKGAQELPQIILMDINLKSSSGIDQTEWLQEHYPEIKVLALSMEDNPTTIVKMLKAGASGYLLKDMNPEQFIQALDIVLDKGFYHSELVSGAMLEKMSTDKHIVLKDHEKVFLEHVCTDKTYKEIAAEMYLSPKTIDKYRESLFKKFQVKSRTALALFSIKKGYVDLTNCLTSL